LECIVARDSSSFREIALETFLEYIIVSWRTLK
jgi:hypothetical protein